MPKKNTHPSHAQIGWIKDHAGVHPTLALFSENHIDGGPEGSRTFGYAIYVKESQAMQAIPLLRAMSSEHPEYQIEVFAKPGPGPTTYPEGVTRTITVDGDGKTTISVKQP